MSKYKIYGEQRITIWDGSIEANSKKEAIDMAYLMNHKSGLGMKYMDCLEASTISFYIEEEE
tara:strand:+ start:723 stop:908 length:186 start_codon:yes stop_codon:yes gene_type:complete